MDCHFFSYLCSDIMRRKMKLPRVFRHTGSIAEKLTWRVILSVTLIFTLIVAFILFIVWVVGFYILLGLNGTAMAVSNERINNVFITVETAISNNIPEVEVNIGNDARQYFAQENLLRLNPNIVGSAVAYNPNYEPKKGEPSSPYAFRDDTGIHTKQLNREEYDYLHQEWYVQPILQGKGVWSEPYIDEGGGDIPMITYSLPLINEKGEIYAVETADISLDWLTDLTQKMDSAFNKDFCLSLDEDLVNNAYSFIVSRKGTFVVHPDKKMVLKESLYTFFQKNTNESDSIVQVVLNSNEENLTFFSDKNGRSFTLFYAPIEHTGWTMGIIVPTKNIMEIILYFLGVIILLMIVGLIIVALVCRKVIRNITKPLERFAASADEIAKGNFDAPLPIIKGKDEMRRLHDSFKLMQFSLVDRIEELKTVNEEKGRIESELSIARNIQMAMLPKIYPPYPDRSDIDIYGQLTPAKEVGGDLYDFYIRDEKLFFCIGDVSGKGVPASLVMAMTRAIFRTVSAHESRPSKIIKTINKTMSESNDSNMFVTFFVGVLDLPTGRLRYCNGGHNAPITIYNNHIDFLDVIPNLPVGVINAFDFKEQETVMPQGASIFLFTDGLNEAENSDYVQLGDEKVLEVAQQMTSLSAKEQIGLMTKTIEKHTDGAEQSDDLTMLSIRYLYQQDENAKSHRLTLKNNVEELTKLPEFVDTVCEEAGVDMAQIASLNLALEEAVTNVVLYAYPESTGTVDIDAIYTNKYLKFIITDSGIAFDPTKKEDADITLTAEERPIGGLGIYLVRQIMDSVNYERIEGHNILTLFKKLEPAK